MLTKKEQDKIRRGLMAPHHTRPITITTTTNGVTSPMPVINEITETIARLGDTKIELLIRAYAKRQAARMAENTNLHFYISPDGYSEEDKNGYWEVSAGYSKPSTKGAVLSEVATEQNRRTGFKSTLLMIESGEAATAEIDGEAQSA